MKKPGKKVMMCSLFSFLLTLLIFLLITGIGITVGVFNDKSVVNKLSESNYYNKVYEVIHHNAEEAVKEAGFPTVVLENVITLERVYIGGKNYVNDVLNGTEPKIKTDKLRETLLENVDRYLDEQGLIRTEEMKNQSEALATVIEEEYRTGINLKFVDYYTEYRTNFMHMAYIGIPMILLLIFVICAMLIRMNQYKHRAVRYINYALIAASCLIILMAIYLLAAKHYSGLNLSPDYYNDFLITYLRWDIMVFLYLGEIGMALSLVLLPLTGYMKNRIFIG